MQIRLLVLALLILQSATSASALNWYGRGHGRAPAGDKVYVCHGYTCRIVTGISFTAEDVASIAGVLATGASSPETEREAVSEAVQRFETIVGARIGTASDLAGMQFGQGTPDQMDCIDEATNTTSLLLFLSERGYIKHHRVVEPSARGFFLDGRYPHATAVLRELASGDKWAVDSWPRANAQPPVIQPLSEWKRSRVGALPSPEEAATQ
jgi:hypothetical protein